MENKIKPNKKLGQNFLVNKYTINTILEILDIKKDDHIIEVGPGKGALTDFITSKTKNYIGVEKDNNLCDLLNKKYNNNIKIINEDILKIDIKELDKKKFRIVGNIPYNISTKLILKCIDNIHYISNIHFMMQKEFVDRLISEHGKKTYGRLSVLTQVFFKVEKYIDIKPNDFYPEPKIFSSFVSLTPLKSCLLKDHETDEFLLFVKEIFNTRRKKIKNCISINSDIYYDSINKRAEELSISEMIKLYRDLKSDGKFI